MDQRFDKRMINVLIANHMNKKNVVWVQSGNDFVDLHYSFLTMPLGTIARLLEQHGRPRGNVTIGCLNNLYKSIVDMRTDHFRTEACKEMLLYPKSVKEGLCRKLKINIDDTEATKYFMCPRKSCPEFFSNFDTSRCSSCGNLMNKEIPSPEGDGFARRFGGFDDYDEVFVRGDGNLAFILSDDLKIENFSHDLLRKKIKDLGCINVLDEIGEGEAEIGFREAMTLLQSLFTSETPLTTTFFPCQSSSYPSTRAYKPSRSPCDSVLGQVLSLKVYLSKHDRRKVVYVVCREGFIDLLCTFLVLPLEYICKIYCRDDDDDDDDDDGMGCIGNLFRSFKGLSCNEITIPWYYSCRKNLLGITVQNPPSFYRCISCLEDHSLAAKQEDRLKLVTAIDPKTEMMGQPRSSGGFVKSNKKFLVSDDLRITPLKSDLTMRELKDLKISFDDVKIEEISIGRAEAINLLKASFVTSSALTNGLSDLLAKKLEG
ncbi:hypothetical protein EUTSA_v10012284mg [Eutrema salsugineum]|uniref:Uncharacterized protein n=1 Tax=Eutrema salsugineum TaxID=72664 RepID=V4KI65_EUTSA|nr:uncharacterized protein LOC18010607 [Eutrema salsugineum]ESQ30904.1 hypothetical protein EUTSA_v10012284mg [Eutrema salsugineum]